MSWTPIIEVMKFWDRPRSGVALKDDQLVYFECRFDEEQDDYSPEYGVRPISRDLLPLLEERGAIFGRWSNTFTSASTSIETHPALPEDRPRWEELERIIDAGTKVDWSSTPIARPRFRRGEIEPRQWELNWDDESAEAAR